MFAKRTPSRLALAHLPERVAVAARAPRVAVTGTPMAFIGTMIVQVLARPVGNATFLERELDAHFQTTTGVRRLQTIPPKTMSPTRRARWKLQPGLCCKSLALKRKKGMLT